MRIVVETCPVFLPIALRFLMRRGGFMKHTALAILSMSLVLILLGAGEPPTEKEAPKITKEQLKAMLGSKDLILIDVRLDEQWRFSNRKIPGAVHEDPSVPSTWMDKYPKDKTIVFY
jgi:hypothetical protein